MAETIKDAKLYLKGRMMGAATDGSMKLNSGNTIQQTSSGPMLQIGAKTGTISTNVLVVRGQDLANRLHTAWDTDEQVDMTFGVIGTGIYQATCVINSLSFDTAAADGSLKGSVEFDIIGKPNRV